MKDKQVLENDSQGALQAMWEQAFELGYQYGKEARIKEDAHRFDKESIHIKNTASLISEHLN